MSICYSFEKKTQFDSFIKKHEEVLELLVARYVQFDYFLYKVLFFFAINPCIHPLLSRCF